MPASYGSSRVAGIASSGTSLVIDNTGNALGIAVGDLLVVTDLSNNGSATYVYTSGGGGGWTHAPGSPESTVGSATFEKIADAADVAATSFTFTRQTNTAGAAGIAMVRIPGGASVADVNHTSGTGTSLTLAQVTAANANTLLVHVVLKVTTTAGAFNAPPGSASLRASGTASGTALVYAIADETVGSGATGTRAWTYTGSSASRGVLIAVNPGSVAGSGAAALPSATASGAGSVIDSGSGAASLPPATASAAGIVITTGDAASALPAAAGSGSATVTTNGPGATTLPAATASGAGTISTDSSGTATLPSLTASGAGDVTVTGSGTATLPAAAGESSGIVVAISAEASVLLPALTAAVTNTVPPPTPPERTSYADGVSRTSTAPPIDRTSVAAATSRTSTAPTNSRTST